MKDLSPKPNYQPQEETVSMQLTLPAPTTVTQQDADKLALNLINQHPLRN